MLFQRRPLEVSNLSQTVSSLRAHCLFAPAAVQHRSGSWGFIVRPGVLFARRGVNCLEQPGCPEGEIGISHTAPGALVKHVHRSGPLYWSGSLVHYWSVVVLATHSILDILLHPKVIAHLFPIHPPVGARHASKPAFPSFAGFGRWPAFCWVLGERKTAGRHGQTERQGFPGHLLCPEIALCLQNLMCS